MTTENFWVDKLKKPDAYSIRVRLPKDENNRYGWSPRKKITAASRKEILKACIAYEEELANAVIAEAEAAKEEQQRLAEEAKRLTLSSYIESDYMQRRRDQVAVGKLSNETLKRTTNYLDSVKEYFGSMVLQDITEKDLSDGFAAMARSGLSNYKIHGNYQTINQVFHYAQISGFIQVNPCDLMLDANKPRRPKVSKEKKEDRKISKAEAVELIKRIEKEKLDGIRIVVALAIMSGLRRGECLGLTWGDVNFSDKTLSVGYQYTNDKVRKTPKADSARTISISDGLVKLLERWKKEQQDIFKKGNELHAIELSTGKKKRGAIADRWNKNTTPICTGETGRILDPSHVSQRVCRFLANCGLGEYSDIREYRDANGTLRHSKTGHKGATLHSLRRAHATLLLNSGVDFKSLSARLGHSSAAMTYDWYLESSTENDIASAESIDKALHPVNDLMKKALGIGKIKQNLKKSYGNVVERK